MENNQTGELAQLKDTLYDLIQNGTRDVPTSVQQAEDNLQQQRDTVDEAMSIGEFIAEDIDPEKRLELSNAFKNANKAVADAFDLASNFTRNRQYSSLLQRVEEICKQKQSPNDSDHQQTALTELKRCCEEQYPQLCIAEEPEEYQKSIVTVPFREAFEAADRRLKGHIEMEKIQVFRAASKRIRVGKRTPEAQAEWDAGYESC